MGVTAACIAYEAYHIHSIYEDQGPVAALTALGIDIAAIYAGGVILEAATPALRAALTAALDKMPGMRIALGALAERLILATESLAGTKLGQGIAKVETGILRGYDKAKGVFGRGAKRETSAVGGRKVEFDYSTPEAPYSLRVDPLTARGPMHVDSTLFTSADSYTVKGAARNKDQFWETMVRKISGDFEC